MSEYCSALPVLSASEVESIIVDTIECEAEDYQAFDWAPVTKAIDAIRARALEKCPSTKCRGCGVCWQSHPANPSCASRPEPCVAPHYGKSVLRPHTIAGWWQVWSGGICVALLRPEDVAPLAATLSPIHS